MALVGRAAACGRTLGARRTARGVGAQAAAALVANRAVKFDRRRPTNADARSRAVDLEQMFVGVYIARDVFAASASAERCESRRCGSSSAYGGPSEQDEWTRAATFAGFSRSALCLRRAVTRRKSQVNLWRRTRSRIVGSTSSEYLVSIISKLVAASSAGNAQFCASTPGDISSLRVDASCAALAASGTGDALVLDGVIVILAAPRGSAGAAARSTALFEAATVAPSPVVVVN